MNPIRQKDLCGCGVACVAYVLGIRYEKAIKLFRNGYKYTKFRGFYCGEVIKALKNGGLSYTYKYTNSNTKKMIYRNNSLVFIKRSKLYPYGHYLVRSKNKWMDPWINFPDISMVKAGFRTKLPGKPIYILFPTEHFYRLSVNNKRIA